MKHARQSALLYINGERHEVVGEQAFMMLADYLRSVSGLVGTKIVCAEGDCGACSVLRVAPLSGKDAPFEAINACIAMVAQLDGSQIVTVEGLKVGQQLSPVQKAIVECHGSQCGYCTPGFAIAITACVQKQRSAQTLDAQTVKNHLTGNLCRCTGYTPLIEAALKVDPAELPDLDALYQSPTRTRELKKAWGQGLHIRQQNLEFFAPSTLKDAIRLRRLYPKARIISSATDLGVMINKGKLEPDVFLSFHLVPELYAIKRSKGRVNFGARVNLSTVRRVCEEKLPEFAEFLNIFASPQIKNMGTLVGNIANASPIGDTIPFLMVADAQVHVVGGKRSRDIPLQELFVGYRKLALKAEEFISAVSFRIPEAREHLRLYKVSQRKDLDISTVNSAFLFRFGSSPKDQSFIKEARIAYGGVGPTVLRFAEAEDYLEGKALDAGTVDQAADLIQKAIEPLSDVRGSAAYRRTLVDGLFRRYCQELLTQTSVAQKGELHGT